MDKLVTSRRSLWGGGLCQSDKVLSLSFPYPIDSACPRKSHTEPYLSRCSATRRRRWSRSRISSRLSSPAKGTPRPLQHSLVCLSPLSVCPTLDRVCPTFGRVCLTHLSLCPALIQMCPIPLTVCPTLDAIQTKLTAGRPRRTHPLCRDITYSNKTIGNPRIARSVKEL